MLTDPVKNLKALALPENSIVADLGAGTGFYSIAAAHLVPRGKVYAVEISKDYLHSVSRKAHEAHLNNLEVLWGDIEKKGGTKIKDGIIDAAIASNVLFQLQDRKGFLMEIKRILKPKGRVLIIESAQSSPLLLPGMAISKEKVGELFNREGFVLGREINAGEHHYGMIFERP